MFLVVQLLYAIRLKSRTMTSNEIHVSFLHIRGWFISV